jgi:hypothetical protein
MKELRELEKSLKRFLKKKTRFSACLLVAFLISGRLIGASTVSLPEDTDALREDLLSKIAAQRAEIEALLAENEARLRELQENYELLLRQGDYYAKPVYKSQQVFFSYSYESGSTGSDRTETEFRQTLEAADEEIRKSGVAALRNLNAGDLWIATGGKAGSPGGKDAPANATAESLGIDPRDISRYSLTNGAGTIVSAAGHKIEVDLGVNIIPLEPKITEVTRNIDVSVSSPSIQTPSLNMTVPVAYALGALTPPSISVNVVAPSAIPPLAIDLPAAPNPTVPASKAITLLAPSLPNDYEPTMVTIPEAPTTPVINIPTLPTTDIQGKSIGNSNVIYADDINGLNAFVTNVAVLQGEFRVHRDTRLYEYEYNYHDYTVNTYIGATSSGIAVASGTIYAMPDVLTDKSFVNGWNPITTPSGLGTGTGTGIMGVTITYEGTFNNGNWLVSRTSENAATNAGEFVHMDNHGATNSFANLRTALANGVSTLAAATQSRALDAWDDAAAASQTAASQPAYWHAYSTRGMYWLSTGNIILEGGNMSLSNQYDHSFGTSSATFAINAGEVTIRPYIDAGGTLYDAYNAAFLASNDSAGDSHQVMYNSGTIRIYTNDSAAWIVNSPSDISHFSTTSNGIGAVIVNRGVVEMMGKGSLGVFARAEYFPKGTIYMDFTDDGTNGRNPIQLFGDSSIGLYIAQGYKSVAGGINGNFHADIGSTGVGNKALNVAAANTDGGQAIVNYYGDNDTSDMNIQGSVGVLAFKDMDLTAHGIVIYDKTKQCIAVVPLDSAILNIGSGTVQLNGGANNIGLIAADLNTGGVTYTGGTIASTGNVDLIGGDRNIGVAARDGHSVTLGSIISSTATPAANAIGLYGEGAGSVINVTNGIGAGGNALKLTIDPLSTNNHTTMAALARTGATINMDVAALPSAPQVVVQGVIEGTTYRGYAFLANGGTINARRNYVKVDTGAAGVIALNGGVIHMENGKIDYSGRGFAVYTDNNAATKVYLNDGEIVLRGKGVGITLDVSGPIGVSKVDFGVSGKITMMSNDAVALNLEGMTATTLTGLITTVQTGTSNVSVVPGTDGITTYDKYRLAATDGGDITIDVPIDKSHDASWTTYDPSFFFFRSFLAQKSIIRIEQDVTAQLNSTEAADYFKGYVSGMEMNSSPTATSAYDSLIELKNGATILADRTDAGAGAIGVYVNFGATDIQNGTKINVETGANVVNDGGIGIYGVDGSIVVNNGEITVNGDKGVGLLGLAYRPDSLGHPVGEEFGGIAGEGVTTVTNGPTGKLVSKGDQAIGIYVLNNSSDPTAPAGTTVTTLSLTNNGTIEVGTNATAKNAVGVYADGDVKVNLGSTSNITTGEEGVSVYGANGAEIQTLGGTFNLGKNGIAVVSDGTAKITATGTFALSGAWTAGTSGKVAIAYVGPTPGTIETTVHSLGLNIDVSALDHGTALYLKDKSDVTTTGTITVGNAGVGIYLDNGDGTNAGTINLVSAAPGAVGMYTIKGKVTNAATGVINVNNSSQIGITGVGSTAVSDNLGAINLNANGSVGVLLDSGASLLNQGTVNFGSSTASFAIVSNASSVTLSGTPPVYTMANSAKNIYVYGKNGTTVNLIGNIIIDGVAPAGSDKSVGIYLDGTAAANTVTATGSLEVRNGAVGVYSKKNNNLFNGTYTATGDGTVAVYFEDAGTLNGTVINADAGPTGSNAIGIYGAGGGDITVGPAGISVNLGPNRGTGLYLAGGAVATGGTISITNTGASTNPGIYYIGTSATHGTDLVLLGSNTLGLYAGSGISLTNSHNIAYSGAGSLIGAYVGDNSTYTSASTGDNISTPNSAGIFVAKGSGINTGTLQITSATGAAMVAKGEAASTATIENRGTITTNNGVAMLLGDTTGLAPAAGKSVGKNTGTIAINNGAIGVALSNYDDNKFDGTGGTFTINNGTGIYILNTTAGAVTATGTLNLTSANALGVYADGAVVDFPVTLTGSLGAGLYATGATSITGTVDASGSNGTVAVYIGSGGAATTFSNATIKTGNAGSAVGVFLDSLGAYTLQGVAITADGAQSMAGYVTGTNLTDKSTITVDNGAMGLYLDTSAVYDTDGNTINIGTGSAGVYNKGTANLGVLGPVNINFTGIGGIAIFNDGGTINIGTQVNLGGTGTGTFAATANGNLSNSGTINVSTGATGLLGKYSLPGSYNLTNLASGVINVTAGGIGMGAIGTAGTVTLDNSGTINVDGADSIGVYTDIGTVMNNNTINVTNDGIGIYVTGAGSVGQYGTLNVSGGIGVVVDGGSATGAGAVTLNAGTAAHYSIGAYFTGASGTLALPTITQTGAYSIAIAVDNSTGVNLGPVNLTGTAGNQVGYLIKNSSVTAGTVSVAGDENLGIFADNSTLTTGNITVADATNTAKAIVGVYAKNGSATAGTITVGKNSVGLYGNTANLSSADIAVDDGGVGIYAKGSGTHAESASMTGTLNAGAKGALGLYGDGVDLTANITGTAQVGKGTSVAVVSEGVGNVSVSGNINVAAKGDSTGSIALYKKGAGNVSASGSWTIGRSGYAVFLVGDDPGATGGVNATSALNLTLGQSAVGIFADAAGGAVSVTNTGTIDVGDTWLGPTGSHSAVDSHENSVGMYLASGAKGYNSGAVIADEDHSVGVYATGAGSYFENNGTITVSNGSTGILAKAGASVVNNGTIRLLDGGSACGAYTIGVAVYQSANFVNSPAGEIYAGDGIGVYVANGASMENQGRIYVDNGVGIQGKGVVVNSGQVIVGNGTGILGNVTGSGTVTVTGSGTATGAMESDDINEGAVTIDQNGIKINGQYIAIGGTFVAHEPIELNGAFVDITTLPTTTPLFTAPDVSGTIYLTPNFAKLGNGFSYHIENFMNALASASVSKITVATSPLFIAKQMNDGSLLIAKKPYNDMTIGEQFKALHDGLDNLLYTGQPDSGILKNLNSYLEGVYGTSGEIEFNKEASRTLSELRGDIYGTIQSRMQSVEHAFDNAWNELFTSYNITKDSGKYSVIFHQGKFRDKTIGVDDYKYRVQGLLYMKEYEGRNFGNKWGWTLGFGVSRFDFDDAPTYYDKSKEDIYSLRAGMHWVKNLNEKDSLRWITRAEIGYNRHVTERSIEIDKTYKNKASYNSYQAALDTKIEKTVHRSLSSKIDVYAGVNLEYGKFGKFRERAKGDGGALLTVDSGDYMSVQPEIGISAHKRKYIGKKVSVKLEGNLAFAKELGKNYKRNHASVTHGGSGKYDLIRPGEEDNVIKGRVGLTIEKANKAGVTFEVEARKHNNRDKLDVRYGIRFKYVFEPWR